MMVVSRFMAWVKNIIKKDYFLIIFIFYLFYSPEISTALDDIRFKPIIDDTAPVSGLINISQGATFSTTPIHLSGQCLDPASSLMVIDWNIIAKPLPMGIENTSVDFSEGSGVSLVEVSFDQGLTWRQTELNGQNWSYTWRPEEEGLYLVQVRATDWVGNPEIPEPGIVVRYSLSLPSANISLPYEGKWLKGSQTIYGLAYDKSDFLDYCLNCLYLGKASLEDDFSDNNFDQYTTWSVSHGSWIISSDSYQTGFLQGSGEAKIYTASTTAYGYWRCRIKKTDKMEFWLLNQNHHMYMKKGVGYLVSFNGDNISLVKSGSNYASDLNLFILTTDNAWVWLEVTRDKEGQFQVFVDGDLIMQAKDNEFSTSNYLGFHSQDTQIAGVDNILVSGPGKPKETAWNKLIMPTTKLVSEGGALGMWNTKVGPDGLYLLQLIVKDAVGHRSFAQRLAYVDNHPPVSRITQPAGQASYQNGPIQIKGEFLIDKVSPVVEVEISEEGGHTWRKAKTSLAGAMTKYNRNPVLDLDLGGNGSFDSVHAYEQDVIKDGNLFKMWYTAHDGSNSRIAYATSSDGLDWTKQGIALDLGAEGDFDDSGLSTPCVLKSDGLYHMWYSGHDGSHKRIGYAVSEDGLRWSKYGQVMDLGPSDSFDDTHIYGLCVLRTGNQYCMWYGGNDGYFMRIGYAISTNLINWQKKGVAIDLGDGGSFDDIHAFYPEVIYDGHNYRMWYTAHDGHYHRLGYAVSHDGITWQKHGQVLNTGSPSDFDGKGTGLNPSIVVDGLSIKLWYGGYDGHNWRIGYAEQDSTGFSYTFVPQSEKTYHIMCRAIDQASNREIPSQPIYIRFDKEAPTVNLVFPIAANDGWHLYCLLREQPTDFLRKIRPSDQFCHLRRNFFGVL